MLIGSLLSFGVLVLAWLVLPGKADEVTENAEKTSPALGELLKPSQAR